MTICNGNGHQQLELRKRILDQRRWILSTPSFPDVLAEKKKKNWLPNALDQLQWGVESSAGNLYRRAFIEVGKQRPQHGYSYVSQGSPLLFYLVAGHDMPTS